MSRLSVVSTDKVNSTTEKLMKEFRKASLEASK